MAEVQAGRTGGPPQVTCHELCHLLGLGSCRWLRCVMQGALSLDEALRRPLDLCPICLRKLQHVLGFRLVERYEVSCAPGWRPLGRERGTVPLVCTVGPGVPSPMQKLWEEEGWGVLSVNKSRIHGVLLRAGP